jgi:hypothetical protein
MNFKVISLLDKIGINQVLLNWILKINAIVILQFFYKIVRRILNIHQHNLLDLVKGFIICIKSICQKYNKREMKDRKKKWVNWKKSHLFVKRVNKFLQSQLKNLIPICHLAFIILIIKDIINAFMQYKTSKLQQVIYAGWYNLVKKENLLTIMFLKMMKV